MAVFHPYHVTHACGAKFTMPLARSVNASRSPQLRQAIIDGTFHRFNCPDCGREGTVEKAFHYVDQKRNTLIRVQPRQERHLWQDASVALERSSERIPDAVVPRKQRHMRVVFGLAELREKLILQDGDIDDRIGELLKVMVVQDHPFLTQRPRLRLSLSAIDETNFTFTAAFDHDTERFRCTLPRASAKALLDDGAVAWARTAHGRRSIFATIGSTCGDGRRRPRLLRFSLPSASRPGREPRSRSNPLSFGAC